jgi:hypothetical protein
MPNPLLPAASESGSALSLVLTANSLIALEFGDANREDWFWMAVVNWIMFTARTPGHGTGLAEFVRRSATREV